MQCKSPNDVKKGTGNFILDSNVLITPFDYFQLDSLDQNWIVDLFCYTTLRKCKKTLKNLNCSQIALPKKT